MSERPKKITWEEWLERGGDIDSRYAAFRARDEEIAWLESENERLGGIEIDYAYHLTRCEHNEVEKLEKEYALLHKKSEENYVKLHKRIENLVEAVRAVGEMLDDENLGFFYIKQYGCEALLKALEKDKELRDGN